MAGRPDWLNDRTHHRASSSHTSLDNVTLDYLRHRAAQRAESASGDGASRQATATQITSHPHHRSEVGSSDPNLMRNVNAPRTTVPASPSRATAASQQRDTHSALTTTRLAQLRRDALERSGSHHHHLVALSDMDPTEGGQDVPAADVRDSHERLGSTLRAGVNDLKDTSRAGVNGTAVATRHTAALQSDHDGLDRLDSLTQRHIIQHVDDLEATLAAQSAGLRER